MDPAEQPQSLQPAPTPFVPPPPKFNWNIILIVAVVLSVALLGVSFYQVLSLQKQVSELKTTVLQPTPTPISTGTRNAVVSPAPTGGTNEPIEIIGIVQKSDVEGGCWYIQPEVLECKGDKCPLNAMGMPANYEPLNFPKELQKTGLKAKFKLEVQSGVATTCQLGPAVKILDYQIIK